ncbi:hypothetical protein NLG97_g5885 [Lecanicillium saksenae]|uniref:Uncharacterized protein n=1 Tax=Lecanicillium saksenae TaxID=468837 RepID=A0ACC1QR67_9HYPO|nr:hypothetical protein NLG97_g5885 [Lecanicillium saksenae]
MSEPAIDSQDAAALQELNSNIPYREGAADWTVPGAVTLSEEAFANFDPQSVSHVVLMQEQIMREVGVRYNDGYPFAFWYFIGKIMSRTLFERDDRLKIMSYIPVRQIEYVGFTTRRFLDGDVTDINALEVTFKRPQPRSPMECFWKSARQLVIGKIQDWLENPSSVG